MFEDISEFTIDCAVFKTTRFMVKHVVVVPFPAQYVSRKLPSTENFLPFFLFLGEEEVLKSACSLMYLLNVMFLGPTTWKLMHIP